MKRRSHAEDRAERPYEPIHRLYDDTETHIPVCDAWTGEPRPSPIWPIIVILRDRTRRARDAVETALVRRGLYDLAVLAVCALVGLCAYLALRVMGGWL